MALNKEPGMNIRRNRCWLARTASSILISCLAGTVIAQTAPLQLAQTLSPPPLGEGAPGAHFGSSLAADGDYAAIAGTRADGALIPAGAVPIKLFRRTASGYVREPDLDIDVPGAFSVDMDLSSGSTHTHLIVATRDEDFTSHLRILRLHDGAWQTELEFDVAHLTAFAVAVDGNIAVVGEPLWSASGGLAQEGRALVFRRSNQGRWLETTLLPDTPQSHAGFGRSVAVAAGAVVVGAPGEDVGVLEPRMDAGAAYAFELTQSAWNQRSRLVSDDPAANMWFGAAVAVSGMDPSTPDRILIGEAGFDNSTLVAPGNAHVYRRDSSGWSQVRTLASPAATLGDGFGSHVAMDGRYAVIAAPGVDIGNSSNRGSVYGIDLGADLSGTQLNAQIDTLGAPEDRLGIVAIDRDGPAVWMGVADADLELAPNQYGDPQSSIDHGIVLTSIGNTAQPFPPPQRFNLGSSPTDAYFGSVIAADGDTVMIGAGYETVGLQPRQGVVRVYRRSAQGRYQFESLLLSPEGLPWDWFGSALALRGDVALVAATGRFEGGVEESGAVYAFHRNGQAWELEAKLVHPAPIHGESFGCGLAFDGSTALIGTFLKGAFAWQRSAEGIWSLQQVFAQAHTCTVAVEDNVAVLTDYFRDVNTTVSAGAVEMYRRVNGQWQLQNIYTGVLENQRFGVSVALSNDRLAVGSGPPSELNLPVSVYRLTGNGWLVEASLTIPEHGLPKNQFNAHHLAFSNDRLAVGVPHHTVAMQREGAVHVFDRSAGIWQPSITLLCPNPQVDAAFGTLAWHDGRLLIGEGGRDGRYRNQGALYVFAPPADLLLSDGFETIASP
jgi:hypothetical protein